MSLFGDIKNFIGFSFKTDPAKDKEEENKLVAVPRPYEDGAMAVGGSYSTTIDLDGTVRDAYTLITRYREISSQPEFDQAVSNIVNESIVIQDDAFPVKLNLDKVPNLSDNIRDLILKEFDHIMSLLNFSTEGAEIFKRWYVDGRIHYYKVIDKTNPKKGLIELRYIDPRKVMKVREEIAKQTAGNPNGVTIVGRDDVATVLDMINKRYNEYFIYNAEGAFDAPGQSSNGIKIPVNTISYVPSGLTDKTGNQVISYLHKAIRPFTSLRMAEDASLMYRLSRSSEKRVFRIGTGKLPRHQAESYVKSMMDKFKSRTTIDVNTGELKTDKRYMTIADDIWIPVPEGETGTQIDTLPSGGNLGEMGDVEYYQQKLYEALGIPTSRIKGDATFNLGRSAEILREEVRFAKFISSLRRKFSELFDDLLKTQLILKGVLNEAQYDVLKKHMFFDFLKDNQFEELKNLEILKERLDVVDRMDSYTKKYWSRKYIRNNILQQTDDEIDRLDKEMNFEKSGGKQQDDAAADTSLNSFGSFGTPSSAGSGLGSLPDIPDEPTANTEPSGATTPPTTTGTPDAT